MRSFPHFIKGTLLLTCAGLLCRFSGFFYKIFLAHALGAEGIGIYQLIFPVFAVCHACTASGIESAISRFTAGAVEKERSYALKAGLFLSLSASVLVCVLLWNQAEFIADKLLCESRCVTPLRILAPVIPLSAIHGCLQGYYLGQKKASLPAISQILEQAARIGSVILLYRIFIQESRAITPSLAVLGLLFGEAASALFMLLTLDLLSGSLRDAGVNAFFQSSAWFAAMFLAGLLPPMLFFLGSLLPKKRLTTAKNVIK